MRRRDRFKSVPWLAGWEGDEYSTRNATPAPVADSVAGLLDLLCGQWGYLVDMERGVSVYEVRVWPVRARMPLSQPPVAASYSGTDLRSILASAVQDLTRLRANRGRYLISTREHVRWVA